jgi:large conductance mechanosensitive channel
MSIIGKVLSTVGLGENAINFDTWNPGGIKVGAVITQFINLLLVGFALFVLIKAYNRFLARQDETPAAPPAPPEDIKLLAEIRDLLRKQ